MCSVDSILRSTPVAAPEQLRIVHLENIITEWNQQVELYRPNHVTRTL